MLCNAVWNARMTFACLSVLICCPPLFKDPLVPAHSSKPQVIHIVRCRSSPKSVTFSPNADRVREYEVAQVLQPVC